MNNLFDKIVKIDKKISEYMHRKNRSTAVQTFFSKFTLLANKGMYAILIFIILFININTRDMSYILGFTIFLNALLVNLLIKNIVKRARPFEINKRIKLNIKMPKDYSFPSGHTSVSAATNSILIYFIYIYNMSFILVVVSVIFVLLMGYSRLYLKVHYLTDVVFGLILGIFCAFTAIYFSNNIIKLGNYILSFLC